MARPVTDWPAANFVFTAPEGRDDVCDLQVFKNPQYTVSCWKLSPEELAEVAKTGCVYLSIMGGGMPPVFLGSEDEVRALIGEHGVWEK